MPRKVQCVILKKEADGLEYPPVPGDLGKKLYDNVSAEAWEQWTTQQTMIINEYRLNLSDERAQKMLMEQMQQFFYGGGLEPPPGWVPKSD